MFSNLARELQLMVDLTHDNIHTLFTIIGSLWVVHVVNFLLGYRLNLLGIYPRSIHGLFGIATAPFLHANITHLFFNTIPLFVLALFLLLQGQLSFISVTIVIIILSGAAVWLFGRKALHIGASGVIMGYWGYLIVGAIQEPSAITIGLIVLCLYYFGGFVSSLLPTEATSSWESHIFGLLAGIATNYYHLDTWLQIWFLNH